MSMVFNHNTPPKTLLHDLMTKVNALGNEPRVLIELDKITYVPGMKSKLEVTEWIQQNTVSYVQGGGMKILNEPADGVDRYEFIKCCAREASDSWGLDETAIRFLLAICRHETGYGTLGQGVVRNGSFVLGYGCPSNCDGTYSGITTQFYYGAKRYKEAMGSRIADIAINGLTASDVDWFHEGGDKGYGEMVWSADGANWKNKVWSYYQELLTEDISCTMPQQTQATTLLSQGSEKPVFPIQGAEFGENTGDAIVTSHSGKNPNTSRKDHRGIDISLVGGPGVAYGAPIVSCWDGVVKKSYTSSAYGECVVIRNANGWETLYGHMVSGSRKVSVGQTVVAGQVIGEMGNTGNVVPKPTNQDPKAGTHLHCEMWKDGWAQGGDGWVDPHPILTGAQKVSAGGLNDPNRVDVEIVENVKYNKCFNRDGTLTSDFAGVDGVQWFTEPSLAMKFIGYKKGSVKAGDHKSFSYKHDFSADGFVEYSMFLDLKVGDTLTVLVDGMAAEIYTHEDSSEEIIFAPPTYLKYRNVTMKGANSHIIDFHLESSSGQSTFGLACLKVAEVEIVNGYVDLNENFQQRVVDKYFDTGAFIYSDTFYLEADILDWEINTHFDKQSATARVRLDNSRGIYSPMYQRTPTFPDNLEESPYTWYENGKLQHILSEETPARIYVGYGDNLVRVFTGKIKGEIEESSADRTVAFSCVDKYDELDEHVFYKPLHFPPTDEHTGHTDEENRTMWYKSSIVQAIVRQAGLVGWRYHMDDLRHPDFIVEETVYIDIDKGSRRAVKLDELGNAEEVEIEAEQTLGGYLNPYVETAQFDIGARASDSISQLLQGTYYHARCNRNGTFLLYRIPTQGNIKWEFVDDENLYSMDSSIDHSRIRNHIMVSGSGGTYAGVEHFFDKDLLISLKGKVRSAGVQLDWVDERYGSNARGQKEEVAERLFFDMKRQARTMNVIVKGNPMIDILDGCYIYDRSTSSEGYYLIKGNRLVGNKEGMVNFLELTWENLDG